MSAFFCKPSPNLRKAPGVDFGSEVEDLPDKDLSHTSVDGWGLQGEEIYVGSSPPLSSRRSISSMEGGSLASVFNSDGSGLPDKTDAPDGNLRGMSMSA